MTSFDPVPQLRVLDLSTERVRQLVAEGKLQAIRIDKGMYLFRLSDVEGLRAERVGSVEAKQ